MSDYFEIVVPRQKPYQVVRLESAEWGTATILCVRPRVRITFEMTFPTQEAMDAFLEARRFQNMHGLYGGRITALTPMHLSESLPPAEGEDGTSTVLGIYRVAQVFGVTTKEFRTARMLAQSVILSGYMRGGKRKAI